MTIATIQCSILHRFPGGAVMLDARPGLVLRCDWLVALLWHAQPSYWLVAGPAHREGCVVNTNNLGYKMQHYRLSCLVTFRI